MHRPPAVPLIVNDPHFSLWSMGEKLTDVQTKHWTGPDQPMNGLVHVDGKLFRWMGLAKQVADQHPIEPMKQLSIEVRPLHTLYRFSAAGVELDVTFFTPLLPGNLNVLSRPVSYLSWEAKAEDGSQHKVDLLLDVSREMAVNQDDE